MGHPKTPRREPGPPASTLSGVECLPSTPCEARLKTFNPATAPPGARNCPHSRAGITTLPGSESAAESASESAANPTRITAPDRSEDRRLLTPPDSGTDRHPETARPRHKPARPTPNPRLKEKLSQHPGNPQPSPAPGSLALSAQKRQRYPLCPAVGSRTYRLAILGYQVLSSLGFQSRTRWRSSSAFSAVRPTTSATPS